MGCDYGVANNFVYFQGTISHIAGETDLEYPVLGQNYMFEYVDLSCCGKLTRFSTCFPWFHSLDCDFLCSVQIQVPCTYS